jgi:hypothetical protein
MDGGGRTQHAPIAATLERAMSVRLSLLVALIAVPGLAWAQAPAAANPKLAAYVGHTCSYAYKTGISVNDEYLNQGGNIVVHHRTATAGRRQDQGVIPIQPAAAGKYTYKSLAGSQFVLQPHDTPSRITVTVTDGNGTGTSTVDYACQ